MAVFFCCKLIKNDSGWKVGLYKILLWIFVSDSFVVISVFASAQRGLLFSCWCLNVCVALSHPHLLVWQSDISGNSSQIMPVRKSIPHTSKHEPQIHPLPSHNQSSKIYLFLWVPHSYTLLMRSSKYKWQKKTLLKGNQNT